jgi:hypothetical protein
MRKTLASLSLAALLLGASAGPVLAAPLPDNCTKDKGTVTCTTFTGPGKNQGGVGSTSSTQTQGNTTNTSPTPQDLQSSCTTWPAKSQGAPNTCP